METAGNKIERSDDSALTATGGDRAHAGSDLYRLLWQHSGDIIWFIRPDGRFVDVNRTAIETYGYSHSEFLTMNVRDLRHPSVLHEVKGQLGLASSDKAHFETIHLRRDGTSVPVEVRANSADFAGERLIMAIVRDITDRKTNEAALKESEERRQLAQEAGQVGIFDWDIVKGKTYWSETMWAFYGEEPSDVNPDDTYWSAHLHSNDRERVKLNIQKVLESEGSVFQDEFRITTRDGITRWMAATAKVTRDEAGAAVRMYGVNIDITKRKEVEARLRFSENQLRLVLGAVPALIAYIDRDQRYRFVNARFTELLGLPNSDIVGQKVRDIFGRTVYGVLKPYILQALSGESVSFEARLAYRQGGERYVHASYVPDIDLDGVVHGFYGVTNDRTDLRRSEDLLRSSEEHVKLLMESFTDYAIFSIDPAGRIDTWNRGAELIFGYDESEILGQPYEVIFTPDDVTNRIAGIEMRRARRKGRSVTERWHIRKDGTRFFASGVMMPLFVGGSLTGYAKIASDLTVKKRHAEELQRAHAELEIRVRERTRELAETNKALIQQMHDREVGERDRIELLRKLVTSQESERRRIALDLHDQLGQRLTALRLKIASLKELSVEHDEISARVERLQEIAERLDSEVSFLAWELRPTALDDLGLVKAVGTFVDEWSRHHEIPADFHSASLHERDVDPEIETHLYRIAQEALNNIAKHSNANHVSVMLEGRDGHLILIVDDNGSGFDAKNSETKDASKGLGLVGMRERASLVGGEFEIESRPGKGTAIFVRIPNVL